MPKVPVVDERLVREISGEARQVSGLEVDRAKNQPALILSVAFRGLGGAVGMVMTKRFVLLSRLPQRHNFPVF